MKRCKNRVPESMAGNVPPHQRPQCDREYDPSLGGHGGKCKATRRHKNHENKHVGHTEWQWYAARVDRFSSADRAGNRPSSIQIHINPPHDGLGLTSTALGPQHPQDRYRDVMARARLANGGRGATEPVGSTKFQRVAAECACPDAAAGTLYHVSPCRKAGLLR